MTKKTVCLFMAILVMIVCVSCSESTKKSEAITQAKAATTEEILLGKWKLTERKQENRTTAIGRELGLYFKKGTFSLYGDSGNIGSLYYVLNGNIIYANVYKEKLDTSKKNSYFKIITITQDKLFLYVYPSEDGKDEEWTLERVA